MGSAQQIIHILIVILTVKFNGDITCPSLFIFWRLFTFAQLTFIGVRFTWRCWAAIRVRGHFVLYCPSFVYRWVSPHFLLDQVRLLKNNSFERRRSTVFVWANLFIVIWQLKILNAFTCRVAICLKSVRATGVLTLSLEFSFHGTASHTVINIPKITFSRIICTFNFVLKLKIWVAGILDFNIV